MTKALLGPAFFILKRLSFRAGFTLAGVFLLLPAAAAFALLPSLRALPAGDLLLVAVLVALAVYAQWALYAYMIFGITRIVRVADRIASGELLTGKRSTGDDSRNNDADRLWQSIMKMNASLGDIVVQVRASAEAIVSASQAIAEGHSDLSQRTEEQAASVEETAAGIEHLAQRANENAANCERAAGLSGSASEVAGKAALQMEQMQRTMQRIDTSAQQVSDILATVEGIAFQTNILALNAAVEAARAGDQGRGFAVVAEEVRNLAQRSSSAAREIKGLIAASLESAGEGRKLVDAAGGTMRDVVTAVGEVSEVLKKIAAASAEQSAGVAEINRAIGQIDAGTQRNAALVEETMTAAMSFQRESALMLEAVSRFKLDRSDLRGRVSALVKKVAAHVRRHGAQQACADLNARDPRFLQGDSYVFAVDMAGVRRAYPPDPAAVGRNGIDDTDADGRYFCRELIRVAETAGAGWCDFKYLNPGTGRVEPKSVYIERAGDLILGCGIYLEAQPAGAPARGTGGPAAGATPQPRLAATA